MTRRAMCGNAATLPGGWLTATLEWVAALPRIGGQGMCEGVCLLPPFVSSRPKQWIKMQGYRYCRSMRFECRRQDSARNPRCAISLADETPRAHHKKGNYHPESECKNTAPCRRLGCHANRYKFPEARKNCARDATRKKQSS